MARSAKLTPWRTLGLILALVLAIHLVGLEWASRRREQAAVLQAMAPPMFTRLLEPATPPPVVAQAAPPELPRPKPKRRSAYAVKPQPKASEPKPPEAVPEPVQVAEVPLPEVTADRKSTRLNSSHRH